MKGFDQNWLNDHNARLAAKQSIAAAHQPCANESDLHDRILGECKRRGWIALHGRMDMATGRTVGEPDFTILADAGRVYFVECKAKGGKLKPEQVALKFWADRLGHTIHIVWSFGEFLQIINQQHPAQGEEKI